MVYLIFLKSHWVVFHGSCSILCSHKAPLEHLLLSVLFCDSGHKSLPPWPRETEDKVKVRMGNEFEIESQGASGGLERIGSQWKRGVGGQDGQLHGRTLLRLTTGGKVSITEGFL
jgi:hypothetical protein